MMDNYSMNDAQKLNIPNNDFKVDAGGRQVLQLKGKKSFYTMVSLAQLRHTKNGCIEDEDKNIVILQVYTKPLWYAEQESDNDETDEDTAEDSSAETEEEYSETNPVFLCEGVYKEDFEWVNFDTDIIAANKEYVFEKSSKNSFIIAVNGDDFITIEKEKDRHIVNILLSPVANSEDNYPVFLCEATDPVNYFN